MTSPAAPPHPIRAIFGERLRARRQSLGLSQADLHERSGIAISFISGVEAGKRGVTLDVAARLATALDTDLATLLRV